MSKNFLIAAYEKLQQRLRYGLSHTAADALNDAFLKLWAGDYNPSTSEEGEKLLSRAVRHRQISLWRHEKRHPKTPVDDGLPQEESSPENDADEMFRRVHELVMTELTPLQKDILTSHDMNDESYAEIAERLGMQEAAVRMQLSRARRKIREMYKKMRK